MRKKAFFLIFFWTYILVVQGALSAADTAGGTGGQAMKLTSTAFEHNAMIPAKYTCEGKDVNPPLEIQGIPEGVKTLVLIVDDPDAPMGTWVHWVVFNIPVASRIEENSVPGLQGRTNFGTNAYGGPCPPSGTHRYFFKLYALDSSLPLQEGISKGALEKAMQGHILAEGVLMGKYERS